jgi:hypothetical protein
MKKEMFMRESFKQISFMEMENSPGTMAAITRETG